MFVEELWLCRFLRENKEAAVDNACNGHVLCLTETWLGLDTCSSCSDGQKLQRLYVAKWDICRAHCTAIEVAQWAILSIYDKSC